MVQESTGVRTLRSLTAIGTTSCICYKVSIVIPALANTGTKEKVVDLGIVGGSLESAEQFAYTHNEAKNGKVEIEAI